MASLKDKVPPHNLDAEQAALGALLLDWDAVGNAIRFLRPERFYSLQNQKIFAAILKLYNEGIRGDLITLIEKLRSEGELDAAGGPAYITSLTDTVATSANIEYYAQIVFDQAVRRDLIKISAEIVAHSHDETVDSRAVLEDAQKKNIRTYRFEYCPFFRIGGRIGQRSDRQNRKIVQRQKSLYGNRVRVGRLG